MRALAQSVERTALRFDRTVGIAFAEITGSVVHGVAGTAELIELLLALTRCALPLLALVILAQAAAL